jgi:hypothetical protein
MRRGGREAREGEGRMRRWRNGVGEEGEAREGEYSPEFVISMHPAVFCTVLSGSRSIDCRGIDGQVSAAQSR